MSMKFNTENPSYEWVVFQGKSFSVTVKGWGCEGSYKWNVYANIYDNHPLFCNPEAAKCLHFHGGCTYDKYITTDETEYKYDWQKQYKTLKVGSDYMHYMDYFEDENPCNGIPFTIKWDAEQLAKELLEISGEHNVE